MLMEIVTIKCILCEQLVTAQVAVSHPCFQAELGAQKLDSVDEDGLDTEGQQLWDEVEALERLDQFMDGDRETGEPLEDWGEVDGPCICGVEGCKGMEGIMEDTPY